MKNKKIRLSVLVLSLLTLVPSIILGSVMSIKTSAAFSAGAINRTALRNQVQGCYSSAYMSSKISDGFSLSKAFPVGFFDNKEWIVLLQGNGAGGVYNCATAFDTLNKLQGKNPTALDLGYTRVSGDSGDSGPVSKCVAVSYTVGGATYHTDKVCFSVRDGSIDMAVMPTIDESSRGNGGVYVGWDSYNLLYYLANEPSTQFMAQFYARTWDEFLQNMRSYVINALDSRHIEFKTNGTTVSGDIHSPTVQESIGNDDAYVSYEITDFNAAKQKMMQYYFGSSQSKQFTWEDVDAVRESSYQLALSTGHIVQRTCLDTKSEALAQTTYAHYDSASNKWCPVDIESRNKAGELTAGTKYPLVASGRLELGLYEIESVLQRETDESNGFDSLASMCSSKASERRSELVAARAAEISANGFSTDRQKYLQNALNTLDDMIRNDKLVNGNVCADLPSVEQDAQTQKDNCTSTFTTAKTELQRIINSSTSTANEKADAQSKLDKINALGNVYWDEDSSGNITCKKLEDVYNGNTGGDPSNPGSTGGQPEENQPVDKCYTAAASLGWFLCPVLDLTGKATSGIYDMVIEPFLQVKSSFFGDSNGGGLRQGWTKFRDFANILFAIAFAVVIFSQVTGIGISNYNIKKILPRLIMVVVLVNLSFILCQLAVDISNILGSSLQGLFEGFAKAVGNPKPEFFSGETWFSLSGLLATVLTSGLLVGAGIAAAVTWEIWLIPLVLAVLACFISIIFFFLILGVRQAGIIVLIAIAPVAIVCYALPNTKSFYDKWFKMFSALLMVYPICGVLIGGGQFASAMLIATGEGNFVFVLVAMLISVVPFFFIPSILRSSMVAMGNLGAKMAAMGSGLGNKATGLLRNSSAVQDRQRQNMIHYNEKKTRGLLRKQERNGGLSAGNQRKLARYGSALNRLKAEDIQAQLSAQSGNFAVAGSAAESRMRQSMQTRQEHDDIAAQQQIYESNGVDGVDINDMGSLATEYESQLDALDGAIASGDVGARDEALMRVKALQNILSKTDAGRGHIQNALNHRLSSNADMYNSNNGEDTALSMAAGHLMANYANDYKKSNRGLYSMLQDLSGRQYTKGMTVSGGHATYKPSFYNTSGIASYTAQTLAGADENAINGIADSIDTMSDSDLETATSLANEALSNPKIELQPKVKSQLQKIVAGGYARGAMSHSTNPGASTVGSSMISQASSQSLDNVISRIQDGDPLTQMTADQVRNVAENARRALESDSTMHDEGTAERLQQVLAAAKARGIKDIDGNNFDPVDSATIKIRGQRQPKVMTKAPVPAGWTEGGLWTGPGTPTKKQQIAYDEWAKHSAEVDRHNSSIPPTP